MKFQNAWVNIARENLTLKLALFCTSFVALGSTGLAIHQTMKDSIVIDRGCNSQVSPQGNQDRTESEIKTFLKEAVSERFDTNISPSEIILSEDEIKNRLQEQKELGSRSIDQVAILRSMSIQGEVANIQVDRIIGVGEIKSVFSVQMIVTLVSNSRTLDNPYGLKAIRFQEVKKEAKK